MSVDPFEAIDDRGGEIKVLPPVPPARSGLSPLSWSATSRSIGPGDLNKTMRASIQSAVDQSLREAVERERFSGVLLLAKRDSVILSRTSGLANVAQQVPVRISTKFNTASMTKLFTSMAIAQLLEQGVVTLDTRVGPLLHGYNLGKIRPACDEMNLEHLLCHTSGLGTYFNDRFAERKDALRTVQDYIDLFKDNVPTRKAGLQYEYSNSGFVLLGAVIETATGRSFEEYVTQRVFRAAGMVDSGFPALDVDTQDLASGYTIMTADGSTSDGKLRNNLPFLPRHASPAGGAYTTAEDLLGFVRAVESGRLVRRDTRQLMMARHGERNRPPFRYQGLGVCLDSIEGHLVWGHGGAMAGANCIVQVCPDLDRTLIVLSNADPPVAYNLAARLLPKAVPQSS